MNFDSICRFSRSEFQSVLQIRFRLRNHAAPPLDLVLAEVRRVGSADGDDEAEEGFAILFRGPGEPLLPQRTHSFEYDTLGAFELFIGLAVAGNFWLTYNGNQILSVWDASGNHRAQATLTGAGTSFDSAFGFSYCNGKVFIVDVAGGSWRGYDVTDTPLRVAVLGSAVHCCGGRRCAQQDSRRGQSV